jgi:hypothetical protein
MAIQNQKAVVVLLLLLSITAFASTNGWHWFTSSNNFSVMYPASWFRISASADRLQLLSSKGGAEGVIIKHGQAEITVMEAQASLSKTLAQVIDDYTRGTSVLSRRDVPGKPNKHGCGNLKEVISKEQPIPSTDAAINVPYVVNTDFFCEAGGHKIVTLLRNWEGDKRQEEYQQIALRMARGIKPLP